MKKSTHNIIIGILLGVTLSAVAVTCWVDVDPRPCPSTAPINNAGWSCTGLLTPAGQTYPWVSSATSGFDSYYATPPQCKYTCTATNAQGLTRLLTAWFYPGARTTGQACTGGTVSGPN